MCLLVDWLKASRHLVRTAHCVFWDSLRLVARACRSRGAVEAENLFLRKQLALFQERHVQPRCIDDSTRWLMSFLSQLFDWRNALVVVKPETLIRWHRRGFRLLWRWKSKPAGRPAVPKNLQELIRKMAAENPTWGEEHIANQLKLKLGIRVSPRTVQKYLANHRDRTPDPCPRWLTFVHNHAQAIVACDFFVVFTARFRILYVLVIMELGRRQILHHNVTAHPSAEWTLQQCFQGEFFQGSESFDFGTQETVHGVAGRGLFAHHLLRSGVAVKVSLTVNARFDCLRVPAAPETAIVPRLSSMLCDSVWY